jgi:hypothetical protein
MAVVTGRVGDGVFGPLDDAADVKDDCEPAADPKELTRGDEMLEDENVGYCWGRAWSDGSLSVVMYNGRWLCGPWSYETSSVRATWEMGGRSSFTVLRRGPWGEVFANWAR